jgi:hypothetical protein
MDSGVTAFLSKNQAAILDHKQKVKTWSRNPHTMGKKNVNPADAHSKWPLKSSLYCSHSQPSTKSSQIHLGKKQRKKELEKVGFLNLSDKAHTFTSGNLTILYPTSLIE